MKNKNLIYGGLLAGGTGSRMETATIPKQFIRVAGIPIFIRTLQKLLDIEEINKVIVSINVDWAQKYDELLSEFGISKERVVLIPGGDTRFKSLVNVAKKAHELAHENKAMVISHDCARIFITRRIITENITALSHYDMVTTSVPTIDTMLESDDGKSSSVVPDRTKLWCDQGPQTFWADEFLKLVSMIPVPDIPSYIEAGKVYLSHGKKIGIVKGERFNFKITNDIDLKYAEFLLKEGYVE